MGSDWRTSFGLMARLLLSRLGTLNPPPSLRMLLRTRQRRAKDQRPAAIEFLRWTVIHLYMSLGGTN
jgi:hypothetical protein